MSILAGKLGDLNPHEDADRLVIWWYAVDEFLWPTAKHNRERARIQGHPMFFSWCSEMGDLHGLIEGPINFLYPEYPPFDLFCAKELVRYSGLGEPGGDAIAVELRRKWEEAWSTLIKPPQKGSPPLPHTRHCTRGLKFSLLALVLRLGVFDGSPSENGKHRLVSWTDALDAASLQLALSIFWLTENSDFNPPVPDWQKIKVIAAMKLDPSMQDPKELKHHAENEGIEGYRKRLRATMNEGAFRQVSSLAAEFLKRGTSGLEKWRKESRLSNWFSVGKA